MQEITSKLSRKRVRQVGLVIATLVAYFTFMLLLIRAPFGLSTSAAQAVSGGLVWSIIVLIVGNRAEGDFLSVQDHADLYRMSTAVLLQVGPACLVVFPGGLQEPVWLVLMMLSMLPCLALATIGRHALFSAEEWRPRRNPCCK
jgi:hypothetical protein